MSKGRRLRRARKYNKQSPADTTLTDALRSALNGHPVGLLSMASLFIHVAKPEPLRQETYLDNVLTNLIGVRNRETTALLAVWILRLVRAAVPGVGEPLFRWSVSHRAGEG